MSYRAFKRLLGETSLERKCRFLFGAGILVLITISFWYYAIQTEELAYDQATKTCRILVNPSLVKKHLHHLKLTNYKKSDGASFSGKDITIAWDDADKKQAFGEGSSFQYSLLREKDVSLKTHERDLFRQFAAREILHDEDHRYVMGEKPLLVYYSAVRAKKNCLECHQAIAKQAGKAPPTQGDLMGVMRIRMATKGIVDAVHVNRAFLISIALVTALLIMTGSWIIVRYVIVKPVKHLKEVSDAISAGELNVRSEIQTGDEFEDLSHAFNRMLRNLVSMQDRLRKVNTDLDRKVDELAQANMALYESNRLKSDFLATMSHELRTPLNSILGFSEVLLTSPNLGDKHRRWAANIQDSGGKLLHLINEILDLARIEAGKLEVRLEEFCLFAVCEGLLGMFRQAADKKNIDLRNQIRKDLPPLRQDRTKVQQIVQNLLSNALKFTPEGGRVLLRAEVDGPDLKLLVSDTGVGIAPEEQELVFEKFRQSGNPLTREHAGTGLGLSIVRELAKLLGGEVTLESQLGRGSLFLVRLPLSLSDKPRLEFDLANEHVDLSKAQKVDIRLYGDNKAGPGTKSGRKEPTRVDPPPSGASPESSQLPPSA